ncbi:MAG: winged helix-turn-helix transcriptional regulator [Alphaproteobacteria bacterium]|nr:winged helix-turn-helix transcriptional regulator [Alphaproteobacteria bacterium]
MSSAPAASVKPESGIVAPADPLELERFVPYRLSVLANTVSRTIARLYEERFDLTVPEWRVLAVLGRFGPMTANEICGRTAMDKVRVSRAVARLLRARRLTRRVESADRRRARLALTPRGLAVYAGIVPLARSAEARLLEALSVNDKRQLERLIDALQARAAALADL